MTESRRRHRRRSRTATVILLSSILTVTSLGGEALAAPGPGMNREESTTTVDLPDIPKSAELEGDSQAQKALTTAPEVPVDLYDPKATTAWTAGSGNAALTATTQPGTTVPVSNGLPIALGVPEGTDPATVAGDWKVDLAPPSTSQEAGVSGLVMKVTPPATADPAAEVSLTVDTTGFADLYGPQAADRFGLMLLPECVYSDPNAGECTEDGGIQTMMGKADSDTFEHLSSTVETVPAKEAPTRTTAAKNAPTRKIVTGTVPVSGLRGEGFVSGEARQAMLRDGVQPAANAVGGSAVGMLDTGSSVQGDFTASPLLSSGAWSGGSSSGAFTYAYQVQTPETAGGLMPKVGLSYSSQSVDGRTSSTNNQASWIGDGWDYNAGSITRTYANCRQDSKKAGSNNATHRTADLCWGSDNATLSLGGTTTELVWDEAKGKWFTANGDGSKIERATGQATGNGAKDGEYWVVTAKDGTRYHFGLNKLPGWSDNGSAADDPTTDSVLTVPVYGNHAGEDCYKAGDWKNSYCTQGWRWNLDYVEDVHGNAMTMWWKKDQNYYARNFNFKAPVVYDRDGYLVRIDYGQRRDNIFSAEAPARIGFSVAERCYTVGSVACTEDNFKSKDPGQYRPWFDTPADLRCESGKKCWNAGPTFWTRKRLDKITTSAQRRTDTTARQVVDVYQLKQSFAELKTGPNTALWLESIQRTGYARNGSTDASVSLNPVRFESNSEDMPNRVKAINPQRPGFSRLRIARVTNEYGGDTVVSYKPIDGDCLSGQLPGKKDTAALKANNRLCYPSFWNPDPEVEDIDWFHKYVVESIEELPNVDGAYPTKTAYAYKNPAWKLSESEFTKKSTRTYSQFAGAEQTTVVTGVEDPAIGSKQSKSVTRYLRGMGDTAPVKDVHGNAIKSSDGSTVYDREAFAGRVSEELTYSNATDADTDWLTRSITVPEATELAKRNRDDGLDPLKAWRVTEPEEIAYTKSSGTNPGDARTERILRTKTTYEAANGLPTLVESFGDTGKTGDETCTRFEYLNNTAKNLIGITKQALTSPTSCAAANFADLKSLTGGSRVAYDGQGFDAAQSELGATTRALPTETWSLKGDGTGFETDGTSGFDAIGRVVRRTDADQKVTNIAFDPPTGQAFKVSETNPLGHLTVQELDPGRGVSLKTTDPNGATSEAKYDPLGRLAEGWAPGRTPTASAVPDFRAEYTIPAEETDPNDPALKIRKPPFVTTHARGHEDRIETSVTLYDGLGRERQSMEEPESGDGYLVTDTLYNSSGEVWQTNNSYLTKEAKIGELFKPLADTAIPNITRYTHDGLGRVVAETPYMKYVDPVTKETSSKAYPERATRYEYGQDWSKVVNPEGTSSYRVFTDAQGRSSRVDTFNPAAPGGLTSNSYEYNGAGLLSKATASADPTHPWTWTYDRRGRVESATDPDSGTTRTTYDHRGRPLTVTNARGVTVWNGYDELSRPKTQKLDGSAGTTVAEFTYDTVAGGKGLPATATRYTDGLAYTQKINAYTKDYEPSSTTLNLPASLASTWGLPASYTYNYEYTDQGLLQEATLPAAGKFDSEKMVVRYNDRGLPVSVSGKDWYGSETVYSPYGQVLRSTLGSQPYRVWAQNSYDESSGALTDQSVYREQNTGTLVGGNLVSNRGYTYDPSGNVTAIQEKSVGIEERQCFAYDPIGQLKSAWTSKEQANCTAPKNTDGSLNVAAGKDNSGYWQEYEYDLLGNRTKLTEKDLAGDAGKDAVSTYEYGKNAAKDQPHTLTKVTKKSTTPAGAQVTTEAQRLYELTGETKSVTSAQNGEKQDLAWTYDGQIDRITGQGSGGRTPYVGLGQKCLDLRSGLAAAGTAIQLHACNGTVAQSWRFTPVPGQADANLGTLSVYDTWCLQPAANTAGSAAQLSKCDGTAAQQLKRNASGQLTHVASGLCLAVQGATNANSTPVVLAACDAAQAAQQWLPQNDTRHIYGPDGARLLTIQGKQATLHLGETEVTVQQGGVLVRSERTYASPGGAVMRYANGTSGDALVAVTMDHQGSAYTETVLGAGMAVRVRKQDPFGNQRSADTGGQNLQTHQGFLGQTRNDTSGYQPLGARLYDPAVGRFLSDDPVLDLNDPLQSNGYTYAHNNPVTFSDPSGLSISLNASERAAALVGAGLSAAQVAQAQAMQGKSLSSVVLSVAWSALKDFIGINDAMACFGGDMWSCGSLIIGAIPWTKLGKIPSVIKAVNRTIDAIQAFKAAKKAAEAVLRAAKAAEAAALNAKKAAIEKAKKAAQAAKKKAAEQAKRTADKAAAATKKTGSPVQKQAQAKANPKGSSASSAGAGKGSGGGSKASGSGGKPGGNSGGSSRSNGGSSGGGGSGKVPSSRESGSGGTPRAPVVEVDRAPANWNQAERLEEVSSRVPTFALFASSSKTRSRTYVGAINTRTGDTVLASSGGGYCAEGNALLALGGNPDEVIFTHAYTVVRDAQRNWATEVKPVCVRCQADYPSLDNFVPGISAEKGGPWGR